MKQQRQIETKVSGFDIIPPKNLTGENNDTSDFPHHIIHFKTRTWGEGQFQGQVLMEAGEFLINSTLSLLLKPEGFNAAALPVGPHEIPLDLINDSFNPLVSCFLPNSKFGAWSSSAQNSFMTSLFTGRPCQTQKEKLELYQLLSQIDVQFLGSLAKTILLTSGVPPAISSLLKLRFSSTAQGQRNIFIWRDSSTDVKNHVVFVVDQKVYRMTETAGKCLLWYCAVVRPVLVQLQASVYPSSSLDSGVIFIDLKKQHIWKEKRIQNSWNELRQKFPLPDCHLLQSITKSLQQMFLSDLFQETLTQTQIQKNVSDIQANHTATTRSKHYGISDADLGGGADSVRHVILLIQEWQSLCHFI
jgi:hypothetical protein